MKKNENLRVMRSKTGRTIDFCALIMSFSLPPLLAQAQKSNWAKQDSISAIRALNGNDSILINEETLRAIREGSLINTSPTPRSWQMNEDMSPLELPIVIDFSEHINSVSDTSAWKIPFSELPPSVAKLFRLPQSNEDIMLQRAFDLFKVQGGKVSAPSNSPQGVGVVATLDLAGGINYLTSKKIRQEHRNKKQTEKTLKELNAPQTLNSEIKKKRLDFITQHAKFQKRQNIYPDVLPKKDSTNISLSPDSVRTEKQKQELAITE